MLHFESWLCFFWQKWAWLCTSTSRRNVLIRAQLVPHPEKISKGGEDAYFASEYLLAVADGVGGWNKQGIDPSLYSRFLCSAYGVSYQVHRFTSMKSPITTHFTRNNWSLKLRQTTDIQVLPLWVWPPYKETLSGRVISVVFYISNRLSSVCFEKVRIIQVNIWDSWFDAQIQLSISISSRSLWWRWPQGGYL